MSLKGMKFRDKRDDFNGDAANVFIVALHYKRISASAFKWRMLSAKIHFLKNRFINGLDIDISDSTKE